MPLSREDCLVLSALSYDLTLFQIVGQKFIKFFVGILVQTMTPKGHLEIDWPLVKNCQWVGQKLWKFANIFIWWSLARPSVVWNYPVTNSDQGGVYHQIRHYRFLNPFHSFVSSVLAACTISSLFLLFFY